MNRLLCVREIGIVRDKDAWRIGMGIPYRAQEADAVPAGHIDVRNNDVDRLLSKDPHGTVGIHRSVDLADVQSFLSDAGTDIFYRIDFVIDN